MRRSFVFPTSICLIALAGCSSTRDKPGAAPHVQVFEGLGGHHRAVTTSSAHAQRYFDQGLTWAYSFNHDEAIRSFTEAARLDPDCAMAWWGIALCNGPHINNPAMDAEHSKAASDAIRSAIARKSKANATDQALIDALAKRYTDPPPADRRPLDEAYAEAMEEVWKKHREDADVGSLFAEALMDLQPWDLWEKDGAPKGNTLEIVSTLEQSLRIAPNHPGANHLYIHCVEASLQPDRALASADRLRSLVPAAGHMVHMPAHIYARTGRWDQASESNVNAIEADRKYRSISPRQGFYRVYMAHNHHFLAFAAMMEGRGQVAIEAARALIAGVPADFAEKNAALIDGSMAIAIDVLMRFGRWDDILNEPAPAAHFPITTALWRYARGAAYAAKGDIAAAEREQTEFAAAAAKVPPGAMMSINPAKDVLSIASHALAGEIAFRRGHTDEAVTELREAVKIEDGLKYMEPPDWIQPVRHTLGAVLAYNGRTDAAERVYREDLARWPENGWSLLGLSQCLKARGNAAEADAVSKRLEKVWSRSDVKAASSCMCVTRAGVN